MAAEAAQLHAQRHGNPHSNCRVPTGGGCRFRAYSWQEECMRTTQDFWRGFSAGLAAGALTGAGATLAWRGFSSAHDRRILRIESSLQIGRSVEEVFEQWSNLENLA